jgi:hypothetical protein
MATMKKKHPLIYSLALNYLPLHIIIFICKNSSTTLTKQIQYKKNVVGNQEKYSVQFIISQITKEVKIKRKENVTKQRKFM